MFLIVGLGNPGKKFENTWHNLGFLAIDELRLKIDDFSPWKNDIKAKAQTSEGNFAGQKVILVKPQTFMNNSGQTVKLLVQRSRLNSAMAELTRQLIIIHDDADLPLGEIKVSKNQGSAGHKGVESIINYLKTKNFTRIRIGVRPENYVPGSKMLDKLMIKKIVKKDQDIIAQIFEKTTESIKQLLCKN